MKKIVLAAVLLTGLVCCKKKDKDSNDTDTKAVFDKQGMLVNYADNVIVPDYTNFKTSFDALMAQYAVFSASGSLSDFDLLKQKFVEAYTLYQLISPNEFGPAETAIIRSNFNVFPVDTKQVNANISAGNYNLGAVSNLDAKGLPALDYLLYGDNATESDMLQLNAGNEKRKKYIADVMQDMSDKINNVLQNWNSAYRTTFINSLGTDVGSSIGFLVNQINYELDYLKNAKIGIPLGKKTLGTPMPSNCEAYYGGQSVEYALKTLQAIENLYLGRSAAGINGKGFDDYLNHLNIKYGETTLDAAIQAQFGVAKSKLSAIQNPLSEKVNTNAAVVDAAYTELVKLLVLLKTDMPSNLGVVITYQDGDGD